MKIRPILASLALVCTTMGVGAAALPAVAGANSSVQLRIADSSAYGYPGNDTSSFCIDGTFAATVSSEQVSDPVAVTPGNHVITLLSGATEACGGEYEQQVTVTVPDVEAATLILNNSNASEGSQFSVLPDDLSCPTAGEGRLIVRNGMNDNADDTAVNFYAAPSGGDAGLVVGGVALVDQGSAELAPGTYGSAATSPANGTVSDANSIDPGTFDVQAGKVTIVFLEGGWDGSPGYYTETLAADCTPTPTTTTAPTTTVAPTTSVSPTSAAPTTTVPGAVAPAATAVTAQPTFTG